MCIRDSSLSVENGLDDGEETSGSRMRLPCPLTTVVASTAVRVELVVVLCCGGELVASVCVPTELSLAGMCSPIARAMGRGWSVAI